MHPQTKPTAAQLVTSWQLIWNRKLNGQPAQVSDAIDQHVRLFPRAYQQEALHRATRTVNGPQSDKHAIRVLLTRGKATLRTL
ncbi:MAG: hypothetical protein R3180_00115 [Marinobacter sp.]|nr:hypothetical protein [Marinobacter sp.]